MGILCKKCGHENPQAVAVNCPQCGVNYADYEVTLARARAKLASRRNPAADTPARESFRARWFIVDNNNISGRQAVGTLSLAALLGLFVLGIRSCGEANSMSVNVALKNCKTAIERHLGQPVILPAVRDFGGNDPEHYFAWPNGAGAHTENGEVFSASCMIDKNSLAIVLLTVNGKTVISQ